MSQQVSSIKRVFLYCAVLIGLILTLATLMIIPGCKGKGGKFDDWSSNKAIDEITEGYKVSGNLVIIGGRASSEDKSQKNSSSQIFEPITMQDNMYKIKSVKIRSK